MSTGLSMGIDLAFLLIGFTSGARHSVVKSTMVLSSERKSPPIRNVPEDLDE
jgi:hypothetical protein